MEVPQGAAVRIRASEWAVPTVCVTDATLDWFDARLSRVRTGDGLNNDVAPLAFFPNWTRFNSLSRCLNWNSRQPQKPLEEVPPERAKL